jgi:glucose/arabinose dehydrogenase
MQFHPVLNTLYFSNNGRDNIGGDVPDDYIAYAPVAGLDFGYPYCHRQVAVRFAIVKFSSRDHHALFMP